MSIPILLLGFLSGAIYGLMAPEPLQIETGLLPWLIIMIMVYGTGLWLAIKESIK